MKARANQRQMRRAEDMPVVWCFWGRHNFTPLAHVKEQFPAGTMCLECQLAIVTNVGEVLPMPEMSLAMHRHEQEKREARKRASTIERWVKSKDPDNTGLVYYMRINGQIKIGYTANLEQRSRNYPPGTELLAIEPAGPYTERDRHQQFHRSLARGREWFTETEDIIAHVAELAATYGVPHKLMHKYTSRNGT